MAVIIGESGAWKETRQLARYAGIIVEEPADIGVELARARQTVSQEDALARDDLAVQQATLEQKLAALRTSSDRDAALIRARCDEDLAVLARRLDPPRPLPLQTVLHLWTWILRSMRQTQAEQQVRRRLHPVLMAERTLDDFVANRETEVARRVEAARRIVLGIEAVARSQELANAVAELEVIHVLSSLPDSFTLLNDVHLTTQHAIRFDNNYLMTAQLDHLLIGPTGIYAVETRAWSKAFLASGDHLDPIEEVKRASCLCWRILEDAGLRQSIHSIVAWAGAMPDHQVGDHVAVMPIARLPSYVQHAASQLTDGEALRIRRILTGVRDNAQIQYNDE